MNKYLKVIVSYLVIFLGIIDISSAEENEVKPPVQYDEIYDPIEPFNRAILGFNFFVQQSVYLLMCSFEVVLFL